MALILAGAAVLGGPPHPLNWFAGWGLVLAAFVSGAMLGVGFHRDDFLGGYASFRRRMVRLGHIALAAMGMMNVIFSLSPWPAAGTSVSNGAGACFIAGGVLMPVVCFLSAWRESLRRLFFLPVVLLIAAVVLTLIGGFS